MRRKTTGSKSNRWKTMFGLSDLENAESAVLVSLRSPESQRSYRRSIDDFVCWYCSKPALPWWMQFYRVGGWACTHCQIPVCCETNGPRMKNRWKPSSPWLGRRVRQGFRGYPIATIAFYGPTAEFATKVVVGIFKDENADADPLEKWFSQNSDIRSNEDVGEELVAFIKSHEVKSVVVTDGIIGCPHEEGIDYPEGQSCPGCPYWAGRDRWTGERIQ